MKLQVMAVLMAMTMSIPASAAEENKPPPEIPPGPPAGSCCRDVLGSEGSSQILTHEDGLGGGTVWTCQGGTRAFQRSWNQGLLPYTLFEDRLTGPIGTWSPWFNSDGPGGVGDYELLKGLVDSKKVCATPLVIECQTVKDGIDSSKKQLVYHCDLSQGGYCVNKEQVAGKSCEDFKVRFLCSTIKVGNFTGSTTF